MKVALDSSTLILLAKINLLRLVAENFDCIITKEVIGESILKKDIFDAKIIMQLVKEKKLNVVSAKTKKILEYEFMLGPGEASTLNLARQKNIVMATDDKSAIKACKTFNIKFVTAIDFVLEAYEKKKITKEEAKNKITKLDEFGRYDTEIIKAVLEKVGDKHE